LVMSNPEMSCLIWMRHSQVTIQKKFQLVKQHLSDEFVMF
jgi:hypothetical protein